MIKSYTQQPRRLAISVCISPILTLDKTMEENVSTIKKCTYGAPFEKTL